jgi:hypothetical protein
MALAVTSGTSFELTGTSSYEVLCADRLAHFRALSRRCMHFCTIATSIHSVADSFSGYCPHRRKRRPTVLATPPSA